MIKEFFRTFSPLCLKTSLLCVCVLGIFIRLSEAAITDGLVMNWPLEQGSGTSVGDDSGNGVVGTLMGYGAWVDGNVGSKAVSLDGLTSYIQSTSSNISSKIDGSNQITVSLWVNRTAGVPIISRWGSTRQFEIDFNGTKGYMVYWRVGGSGGLGTTITHSVVTNDVTGWQHIVAIYDNPVSTVYVNGVKFEYTGTGGFLNKLNTESVLVGMNKSFGFLNGKVDDVRIYNRALAESEVQELYHLGKDLGIPPTVSTSSSSSGGPRTGTVSTQSVPNSGPLVYRVKKENLQFCADVIGGINDTCRDFATIQECANVAKAGDTCEVYTGVYNEHVMTKSGGSATDVEPCKMILGTYPNYTYSEGLCDAKRITFKAVGVVTMQGFDIRHPFITVDGFDITGDLLLDPTRPTVPMDQAYISLRTGSHFTQIINNTIRDGVKDVYGVSFDPNLIDAPSYVLIKNNIFSNLNNQFMNLGGHHNLIKGNTLKSINGWDAFRAFGHDNVIRRNIIKDGAKLETVNNHPDFIQTFSDIGGEGYNYVVEENWVSDLSEYQFGQMNSGGGINRPWLDDNFHDFMFRRNVFVNVSNNFNGGLPGIQFINNTFIRPAYTQGGLVFGGSLSRGEASRTTIKNNIFFDGAAGPSNGFYGLSGQGLSVEVIAYNVTKEDLYKAYPYPQASIIADDLIMNGYINPNGLPLAKAKALTKDADLVLSNGELYTYRTAIYNLLKKTIDLDTLTRQTFLTDFNYVATGKADGYGIKDDFKEVNGVSGGDPGFTNINDPDGPDDIPFTLDDGLKPRQGSRLCSKGEKDIAGKPVDIGVYSCDAQTVFSGGTPVVLTIKKSGAGGGKVAGSGLDCGAVCSTPVTTDSTVTLVADPDNASIFNGWVGIPGCSGTMPCTFTVMANTTIDTQFIPADCAKSTILCVNSDSAKSISNGSNKEYASVQACVDKALPGDTCLVYPGNYPENVDINVPNLRVVALYSAMDPAIGNTQKSITKGFRILAKNVTVKGFDITNYDEGSNKAFITVEPEGDLCEIRDNKIHDGTYLTSTNFYFNANDTRFTPAAKTIENPSGGFLAAGFKAGQNIYIGSNINRQIKNHDTVKKIISVTDKILVVQDTTPNRPAEGLNCVDNSVMQTEGPVKSTIYVSRGEKLGVGAITLLSATGRGTPDSCIISGNRFTNLAGRVLEINGSNHLVKGNTWDNVNGWRMISLFGNNNRITNNVFKDSKRWPDFELPAPGTNFCAGSGSWDMYDTLISSFPTSDQTINDNYFENNFIKDIDEQFASVEDKSPVTPGLMSTRGLTIRNNVFVGIEMTGSFTRPETMIYNNTFYNSSWRSSHNFTIGSSVHGNPTNSIIKNNIFVGSGALPDSAGISGWYSAEAAMMLEKPDYNFVAGPKSQGYPAKAGFTGVEAHTALLGFNGGDPQFINPDNPLGADGLPFTDDDGLRPKGTSSLCRVSASGLDVGAYACQGCTSSTPLAYFTLEDPKHRAPVTVDFTAASSLSCVSSQDLTYTWNFGDGTTGTGVNPSHLYNDGGVFKVTLTVKNASGLIATRERMISVEYPPAPGQILYMNLDGNIKDWAGKATYKTEWFGTPNYVDVVTGKAVNLTSLQDTYFIVQDDELLTKMEKLTIALWAKKSTPDASGVLLAKVGSYRLRINAKGMDAYLSDSKVTSTRVDVSAVSTLNYDTQWHHYALTYDGSLIRLYIDGQLVGTPKAFTGTIGNILGQPILFGKEPGATKPIIALLDDIQIFNLALPLEDLASIVNTTKPDKGVVTPTLVLGDVNKSGSVSTYDASLVMKKVMGISFSDTYDAAAADVSGDGTVSVFDAALIARYAIGIISIFPAEQ